MTIPSTPRKAGPFLGNGATTSFPFAFKVFTPTDIKVVVANSAGVETTLALNSDYSVTLNPNQDTSPGGVVTYPLSGSPLQPGSKLSITGNIGYDQQLDLPSGGNFSPLALENQLDRTTMQIQQLREEMDRTAKLPPTSSESVEELVDDLQRIADSADNLDTVAGSIDNVNTVAANIANVNTVAANIANVNTVGGSIAAVVTVANDLNEPVSEIDTVATNIANVNAVGAGIANVNTVAANIANVNTVGGGITNVNKVGGDITNVNTVAANIANVNTVAGNLTGANTIGTVASNIGNVNAAGGSIANVNTVATNIASVNTVGGGIANVNTVAANIAKVNTVAANLADVTNYSDTYLGPKATVPTTRNDGSALNAGDLYFNTTTGTLYVYDGTAWSGVSSSNIGPASETAAGIVRLATAAEVQAGTDTARAVTPAGLAAAGAPKLRTARTITIGNTGKAFDGSTDVSWSLAEIGAAAATATVNLTGDQTIGGIKTFSSRVVSSATVSGVFVSQDDNEAPFFATISHSGSSYCPVIKIRGTGAANTSTFSLGLLHNTDNTQDGVLHFIQAGDANNRSWHFRQTGDFVSPGNVTAFSDIRLKTDLQPIPEALTKVKALTGYTYTRIDTGERQTGLVAQDVQRVLPEAVIEGEHLSLAYGNLVGLLVEAIKEQARQIEALTSRVEKLEGC